jgi:two-component system, cell cycle sensor histidine kinase and response regulator CckA
LSPFGLSGEQSSPKPILLVDDNDEVRELLARALEEAGYIVLQARDGAEALEVLADGPQVQLLITDILMPGMTGVEVASHFMAAASVPVLFISGYARELPDIPGPILEKPFTPDALVETVKQLLAVLGPQAHPI